MATFTYKARDAAGKPVKGSLEAGNKDELVDKLHKMGYVTTHAAEIHTGVSIESLSGGLRRVRAEDLIVFNIQLSNMINSGISIVNSLEMLGKQLENRKLREVVDDVRRSVESGDSFSQAVAKHPAVFSKLFINMIKAGEASGKLDTVLSKFAEFFEGQVDLNRQIKGALFYPAILLFAGIAVTLFIVTFIIPQFAEIFMKVGIKLPLSTVILYKIGVGIKQFWYFAILFGIIAYLGIRHYGGTETGRLSLDRIRLKLPIVGPLYRKSAISRFARTLGTLVASGVPILESLEITQEVVGNEVLARTVASVRNSVEKGERIAEPLRVSEEFPLDAVQMISVGEESGNLDGMLNKIADFYDKAVGYIIKRLTTLLEPVFLGIMGCLVGFIMASMLLPMFDMMKMLRR